MEVFFESHKMRCGIFVVTFCALCALALVACSTNKDECQGDSDCASRGEGFTCQGGSDGQKRCTAAATGCQKDTDCKGERICDNQQCVTPAREQTTPQEPGTPDAASEQAPGETAQEQPAQEANTPEPSPEPSPPRDGGNNERLPESGPEPSPDAPAPTGNEDVGEVCLPAKGCKQGLECLEAEGSAFCFQTCTDNTDCKDAFRNECVIAAQDEQTGKVTKLCLHRSVKGERCGFRGSQQGLCKAGQTPPIYCDSAQGTCLEMTVQKTEGAACNKKNDNSQPPKICDADSGLSCDEATGTCKKVKVVKEGESCNPDGVGSQEKSVCEPGFSCIPFDSTKGIRNCHKICDPKQAGGCSHQQGLRCIELLTDGRGLCMDDTCVNNADCVFTDYVCKSSSTSQLCLPKGF